MNETQTYLGHAIRVAVRKLGAERFEWTYFIDSSYCFQSEQCLSRESAARDDALAHAYRSIDRLLVLRPPLHEPGAMPARATTSGSPA